MKKQIYIPLLFIAIISIFTIFRFRSENKAEAQNSTSAVPEVRVASAENSTDCNSIDLSGFIRGKNQADVAPKVAGRITKILKQAGDQVKAGEIIATIDSNDAATGVSNSALGVQAAEDTQKQAKDYYDKLVKQAKDAKNAAKKSDHDAYTAANDSYKAAKAARDLQLSIINGQAVSAQANLNQAQTQLSDFSIVAPFSGIILHRFSDTGDFVGPGNPVFTIADPTSLEIVSSIPSQEASAIKVGQPAEISTDKNISTSAHVNSIGTGGDPLSQRTEVRLSVDKKDGIDIGDFANANATADQNGSYLTIPKDAVFHRYDDAFVFALDSQSVAHEEKITVDRECGDRVAIEKNLENSNQLIVDGRQNVKDGEKVNIL